MVSHKFKAPNQHEFVEKKELFRDTRSSFRRLADTLNIPEALFSFILLITIIQFIFPQFLFFLFPISLLIVGKKNSSYKKDRLPLRMPSASGRIDYSDPYPQRKAYRKASGIFFIGNAIGDYLTELWLSARDLTTHMLVFGTTGAGKTEALVSLGFNALAIGSGLFYIDPKGSPKLIAQFWVMSRMCGRDVDLRAINYQNSAKMSAGKKMPYRISNNTNPFAYGNAESLSNMLNSLIPKAEGANSIFNSNARNLMKSQMFCLTELRDMGELHLSARTIRNHLTLQETLKLSDDKRISEQSRDALKAFLTSVGWQEGKDDKSQPRSLAEQFSYARSYFGDPLNSLTDTYGHVYGTEIGEVDYRDIVLNRRICCIVIPNTSMAPEEVKDLGVISLSSLKIAVSVGLGTGKAGKFSDMLYSLPTEAKVPMLAITDEYAAIATPGYIDIITQARSLGISAIVASQDYPGIKKADENAAEQLLENTKTKLFMAGTNLGETFKILQENAGEVAVLETQGHAIKPENSDFVFDYRDTLQTTKVMHDKVEFADIQEQIEGEFHLLFKSKLVRGMVFHADPPLLEEYQFSYLTLPSIFPPDKKEIEIKYGRIATIIDFFNESHKAIDQHVDIESKEKFLIEKIEAESYGYDNVGNKFISIITEVFNSNNFVTNSDAVAIATHRCNYEILENIGINNAEQENNIELSDEEIFGVDEIDTDEYDESSNSFDVIDDDEENLFSFDKNEDVSADSNDNKNNTISSTTKDTTEKDNLFEFEINTDKKLPLSNEEQTKIELIKIRDLYKTYQEQTDNDFLQDDRSTSKIFSIKSQASKVKQLIIETHPNQPEPINSQSIKDSISNRLLKLITAAQDQKE